MLEESEVQESEVETVNPIYEPKGRAKEYGDLAINIYTGCPHRCYYCFAPQVLHREREAFHGHVEPRKNIVQEVERQLEREKITGKLIHLCFTCDPYPQGYDTTPTREIIKLLKDSGNHVQILTKGDGSRDFDLLDGGDWYGITYSGARDEDEPYAISDARRVATLIRAKEYGTKTWVSFEPVINTDDVISTLRFLAATETDNLRKSASVDKVKIGKLNYWPSTINWAKFGREAEALCQKLGLDYYIKDSLRAEMEKV